jgi:mannose-6-phosphate isomerase-like protein (cupin superfamily)
MGMIQPHVINEADCPTDGWDGFRWKTLISSDRTPTCEITQGIAELAPAPPDTFQVHCHAHAETYYVLSGEGLLWIGDEQYVLSAGVVAFIPGGAHHTTCATGDEPLRIFYTFAANSFSDVIYEFPGLNTERQG